MSQHWQLAVCAACAAAAIQIGGGQMDPALTVAFDVDHAQDGQSGMTGNDFGEAGDGRFQFGHRQFDDGVVHGM